MIKRDPTHLLTVEFPMNFSDKNEDQMASVHAAIKASMEAAKGSIGDLLCGDPVVSIKEASLHKRLK